MDTITVSFFGHRQVNDAIAIERKLETIICDLLHRPEYIEFLVGRDGEFDELVASTIRRCKRTIREDNSALVWVMPYMTADFRDNREAYSAYYDEIEICQRSSACHFKAAFQRRNEHMIGRSDYIIFYVERKKGGAYQTLRYAEKRNARFCNLAQIE